MNTQTLRRSLPAIFGLAGLALLLIAQRHLEVRDLTALVIAAVLSGWGFWLLAIQKQPPVRDALPPLERSSFERPILRYGMMVVAVALAVVSWTSISGNVITAFNAATWLGSLAVWMAAWLPWSRGRREVDPAERRRHLIAWVIVLAITAFGGWLRFHRLYLTPYDMTQDHSWKLLDVQSVLQGKWPIFLINNTGREPGQFYYIAALIKLFNLPLDFMALKIGNAIVATATIPVIYAFARELGGRKLGVIAAFLFAISKWSLVTARMGLRYPYATLPAALVLWSLWRYVRLGRRSDALLAGFWMGWGLYGYIGVRAVPFAIIAVFVMMLFDYRRRTTGGLLTVAGHGLLLLVTTALIFLPLGHFMREFPEQFWYRVATRTTDQERSIEQTVCTEEIFKPEDPSQPINPTLCKVGIFAYNNWRMLRAFNWEGDISQVNGVSRDPFVDVITATLLLALIPLLVWRLFVERSLRWWMAFVALPLLFMSTTLSIAFPIENPSTVRTGDAMPLLFALAAAPLAMLLDWLLAGVSLWRWRSIRPWRLAIAAALTLGLFNYSYAQNYQRYFVDYDQQYRYFVPNTQDIAQAIQAYADRGITRDNAYFVGPSWFEPRALSVLMGDLSWHETHEVWQDQAFPPLAPGQPRLYVLNRDNEQRRLELMQLFPTGELKYIETPMAHQSFYIFYIPAS
jgi:hypothetical protein